MDYKTRKMLRFYRMARYLANKKRILALAALAGTTMGCSTTSLECGVDGESSYVQLSAQTNSIDRVAIKNFTELCSFNYQETS